MNQAIIKLENVSKTYYLSKNNKVEALKKVNLEIKPVDFIAIMGPSGSGKSSLLNLLGLLDVPDQDKGKIFIDNKNIANLNSKQLSLLRRKTIGFIFQSFNLLPKLSALDNVLLPMKYAKVQRKKSIVRAKKLLKLVGLENRSHHNPTELSGGEKQRVAIARSLANEPKIILADEPTGNLDTKSGNEVVEILKKLNSQQGAIIIMITHDPEVAKKANKIIKLRDGQLC